MIELTPEIHKKLIAHFESDIRSTEIMRDVWKTRLTDSSYDYDIIKRQIEEYSLDITKVTELLEWAKQLIPEKRN